MTLNHVSKSVVGLIRSSNEDFIGDVITKDNLKVIRPGYGLEPKYFNKVLNKKSPFNIKKDEPLKAVILKNLH